jgi:hypothetical protein
MLLLPTGEAGMRQRHLPALDLSALKDDPTNRESGHSFLKDPRNQELLGGKQRYLLHQIRSSPRLVRRFFTSVDKLS